MAKRKKMGRKESRRDFSRKAGSHPKNVTFNTRPDMRGGGRL